MFSAAAALASSKLWRARPLRKRDEAAPGQGGTPAASEPLLGTEQAVQRPGRVMGLLRRVQALYTKPRPSAAQHSNDDEVTAKDAAAAAPADAASSSTSGNVIGQVVDVLGKHASDYEKVTGSLQRMLPDLVADEAWRPGAQAWADGLRDRTFLGAVAVGAGLLLVDCVGLYLGGICPMPAHALAPLLRPQALIKVAGAGFAIAYQMGDGLSTWSKIFEAQLDKALTAVLTQGSYWALLSAAGARGLHLPELANYAAVTGFAFSGNAACNKCVDALAERQITSRPRLFAVLVPTGSAALISLATVAATLACGPQWWCFGASLLLGQAMVGKSLGAAGRIGRLKGKPHQKRSAAEAAQTLALLRWFPQQLQQAEAWAYSESCRADAAELRVEELEDWVEILKEACTEDSVPSEEGVHDAEGDWVDVSEEEGCSEDGAHEDDGRAALAAAQQAHAQREEELQRAVADAEARAAAAEERAALLEAALLRAEYAWQQEALPACAGMVVVL